MTKKELKEFYSDKDLQWFISEYLVENFKINYSDIYKNFPITKSISENFIYSHITNEDNDIIKITRVEDVLESYETYLKFSILFLGDERDNFENNLRSGVEEKKYIVDSKKGLVIGWDWYEESIELGEPCKDQVCKEGLYKLISFIYISICCDYFQIHNLSGLIDFITKLTKEYNKFPEILRKAEGFIERKKEFDDIKEILIKIIENTKIYYLPYVPKNNKWDIVHNNLLLHKNHSYINIYHPITKKKNVIYDYGIGSIFFWKSDLEKIQKIRYLRDYKEKIKTLEKKEEKLKSLKKEISDLEESLIWFDPEEKIKLGIPEDIEILSDI